MISRITTARQLRAITTIQLAQDCGISVPTLRSIEKGSRRPLHSTLAKISSVLRFPIEFFSKPKLLMPTLMGASLGGLTRLSTLQRNVVFATCALAIEMHRSIGEKFSVPVPDVPDLSTFTPEQAAHELRGFWRLGTRPIINTIHLLELHGVRFFSLPAVNVDNLSWWQGERPYLGVPLRGLYADCRFECAHELGHLVLHRNKPCKGRQHEQDADAFACAFLMPQQPLEGLRFNALGPKTLVALAKHFRVSCTAMLYRLHCLGLITDSSYRAFLTEMHARKHKRGRFDPHQARTCECSQLLQRSLNMLRDDGQVAYLTQQLGLYPEDLHRLTFGCAFTLLQTHQPTR